MDQYGLNRDLNKTKNRKFPFIPCVIQCLKINLSPFFLLFATHPSNPLKNLNSAERIQEMNELERVAALFRCHPDYAAPETSVREIKKLIDSEKFMIFDH